MVHADAGAGGITGITVGLSITPADRVKNLGTEVGAINALPDGIAGALFLAAEGASRAVGVVATEAG